MPPNREANEQSPTAVFLILELEENCNPNQCVPRFMEFRSVPNPNPCGMHNVHLVL